MSKSINDLWREYLLAEGYEGKSLVTLMINALKDNIDPPSTKKSINDLWKDFLVSEGYEGSVNDMLYKFLGDKGYEGSLNDRMKLSIEAKDFFPTDPQVPLCEYIMENDTMTTYSTGEGYIEGEGGSTLLDPNSIPANSGKVALEVEALSPNPSVTAVQVSGGSSPMPYVQGSLSGLEASLGQDSYSSDSPIKQGDRLGLVADTSTGQVDYITEAWHENFSAAPSQVDPSNGVGFVLGAFGGAAKAYTDSSEWKLPYPPGTVDPCGNPVSRELVTYPLDASEAEIQAAGFDGRLELSLAQQKGDYVIQPTLAQLERYVVTPANYFTNTGGLDLSSGGPFAFECVVSLPTFNHGGSPTGFQLYEQESALSDPMQNANLPPVIMEFSGADDGTATISITFHEGSATSPNILSEEPISTGEHVLGMWIDPVGGTVRLWIDRVEKTLTSSAIPAGWNGSNLFPVLTAVQTIRDPDNSVGLSISSRWVTDPYWFTTPFPAGSVAIDGVTNVLYTSN